ncbi:phosphate/phosphite/phosphonate ABC transporter substrate-binding protein [Paraburkholderia lycopersici]|uniref:ABC-type phosphate/phosphonate transport system, substrate-binding protein n=1 Tax=Paraburkholderia lycopersici TaxID=416944 RepID=A0A1G7C3C8_9BURK|nr:PhnD/SsuA/transferrin family substrate-binding protein [Paraburkholderia lycopersici]SDE33166.1 ABC-type phosphate/phosphonate transport system, substrate-binding protein [Paraburkholderia lycopersici]
MSRWIASLPMYNVTPQHATQWRSLLGDCLAAYARMTGGEEVTAIEVQDGELMAHWRRKDLLLSQACGLPYRMLGLHSEARVIATPRFDAPACEGPRYCSALVVSANAWRRGATTLAACRGLRAASNSADSHSGMNAFRHAVAPHARDGRFFSSVLWTGSHAATLRALAKGAADVGAIDCVTLALLRDAQPEQLDGVQIIGMTASAPGLPLIASRTLGDEQAEALRAALDAAHAADPARAGKLRLRGFARLTGEAYAEIEEMANTAARLGYPELR